MMILIIIFAYLTGIFSTFLLQNKKHQKIAALFTALLTLLGGTDLFLNNTLASISRFTYTINLLETNSIFNYSFALDGLSISFLFLSNLLIFLCILFIWDEKNFQFFSINLLIIGLFLNVVFTAENLLVFYLFFEAILVPMYLIIGIWGSRERKIRAVYLFFFYTLVGSLMTLIGIIYIFSTTGTLNFESLCSYSFTYTEQLLLWCAFFISFASKIPMFPMHIWLPEAHVEAPTVGSVLLAGILLKLGVYGLLRFNITLFFDASIYFSPIVYTLSLIGIIYASLAALRQTDIKRIIAYSSIAHMNLVVLGIFSFNISGIEGSILQSISHGFVSGGLFLLVGVLYNRFHTRFLHYYGGLVHFMPIFSGLFLIFTMANIALPGTSSFIGEFLLLLGIYKQNILTAIISALGVIFSGAYSLWLYNRLTYGNIKNIYTKIFFDITLKEFLILLSLLIYLLAVGFSPNIFLKKLYSCSTYLYL